MKSFYEDDKKCGVTNSSTSIRRKSFEYKMKDYVTSEDMIVEITLTFLLVLGTSGVLFLIAFCYLKDKTRQLDEKVNKV